MLTLTYLKFLLTIALLLITQVSLVQLENSTDPAPLSHSCSPPQFSCDDGSKCLSKSDLCDGLPNCDDSSDELLSKCPDCYTDPSMFICAKDGIDVCREKDTYQCDGYHYYCDRMSNNIATQCNNCSAGNLFLCQFNGVDVCINSANKCDGHRHCDGSVDEKASECDNCTAQNLFLCQWNSVDVCVNTENK